MHPLVQRHMKQLEGLPPLVGPVSVKLADVHTGAWRYHRPVIRPGECVLCGICADYCPCGVIQRQGERMEIDYTYCKGCGICVQECPRRAIDFLLEAGCKGEGE